MNPASRILTVAKAGAKITDPSNRKTEIHWAGILIGSSDNQATTAISLVRRLDALTTQVEIAEQLLLDQRVPKDLYQKHLDRLKQSFSPALLRSPWSHVTPGFRPETLVALEWMVWKIGKQETAIDESEFESLTKQVNDLKGLVEQDGLPQPLKLMVRRQIEEIEQAISLYPISGIEPVEEALTKVVGKFTMDSDHIKEAIHKSDNTQKEGMKIYITTLKTAGDVVEKTGKISGALNSAISLGSRLLDMLPPSGS